MLGTTWANAFKLGGVSKDKIPSPVLAQSLSLSFSAQRLSPIQCLETKSKDLRFWKHRKLCQCIVNGSIRAKNAFLAGGCMKAYSTLSQLQCSETKSKHLKVGKHWNFANGFSMLQFVQKTQSAQGGCVKVYPQPYPSFSCSETKSKHLRVGKHWNFANGFSMLQFVQKTHSPRGVYECIPNLQSVLLSD